MRLSDNCIVISLGKEYQMQRLKLDRKGVSFESEAGIDYCVLGFPPSSRDCRFFLYDRPFAMFLIDEHSKANIENHLDNAKRKPYACFRIDVIRYFQKTPDDMK